MFMIHKRKMKRTKPSNLQSMVFWGKTNTKQSTRQHERALCEKSYMLDTSKTFFCRLGWGASSSLRGCGVAVWTDGGSEGCACDSIELSMAYDHITTDITLWSYACFIKNFLTNLHFQYKFKFGNKIVFASLIKAAKS